MYFQFLDVHYILSGSAEKIRTFDIVVELFENKH